MMIGDENNDDISYSFNHGIENSPESIPRFIVTYTSHIEGKAHILEKEPADKLYGRYPLYIFIACKMPCIIIRSIKHQENFLRMKIISVNGVAFLQKIQMLMLMSCTIFFYFNCQSSFQINDVTQNSWISISQFHLISLSLNLRTISFLQFFLLNHSNHGYPRERAIHF